MAESTDRHFLRPSEVLSADRIDAWDAINLVIYAKLPLLTVLKGRDLIAGYLRRNEMHVIQQLKSFPGDMDLLEKYNSYFERLTFPVSPSRYEPLLDQMSRANEYALPYFFHEHHLMVDRRRRAALFATQYKALQGDVMNGDVILQLTEAERAPMLLAGSWMTNNSLKHLLQKRGVLPWWENEKNLSTHALLERVVLSDSLALPTASGPSQEMQAPQRLPEPFSPRWTLPSHLPQETERADEAAEQMRPLPDRSGKAPPAPLNRGFLKRILAAFTAAKDADGLHQLEHDEVPSRIDETASAAGRQEITTSDLQQKGTLPTDYLEGEQHQDAAKLSRAIPVEVRIIKPPVPPEHEAYDEQQVPSVLLAEKLLKQSPFNAGARPAVPSIPIHRKPLVTSVHARSPVDNLRSETAPEAAPQNRKTNTIEPSHQAMPPLLKGLEASDSAIDRAHLRSSRNPKDDSHEGPQISTSNALPQDDKMLTRQGVADVMGLKSANSVDNYQERYPDFPKPHPVTKKRSKRAVQAWLDAHEDE